MNQPETWFPCSRHFFFFLLISHAWPTSAKSSEIKKKLPIYFGDTNQRNVRLSTISIFPLIILSSRGSLYGPSFCLAPDAVNDVSCVHLDSLDTFRYQNRYALLTR